MNEQIKGIDVSYWNGANINWTKVKESGIDFCYVKSTEGKGRIEPLAKEQSTGASDAGLSIGFYHFAHLENSPIDEANFFISALSNLPTYDLLPVLDIEENKINLSPVLVTNWIETFINTVKQALNVDVMIYSSTYFINQYFVPNDTITGSKLWLACYNPTAILPHSFSKYDVWQYSQSGTVNGIQGHVDMNICEVLPTVTPVS